MLFFRFRCNNHIHVTPLNPWLIFNDAHILKFFRYPFNHSPTDIHMGDFTATKYKRNFCLIALFKKALDVVNLKFKIMTIRLRPKLYFLQQNMNLLLFCFLQLFTLLILELAIVHYPADRWNGCWRNLHKIQLLLFGQFECLRKGKNAQRLSCCTNYTNLRNPDGLIDIDGRFCYGDTS